MLFSRTRLALLSFALACAPMLSAGSTGTGELQRPQGSTSGTANGDYVSDADLSYRYFVEVPPNVPRLAIDLFDADIGAGGASEDTAGRDRDRGGYNTSVTYSLRDPFGNTRVTAFNTGSNVAPVGADNAWLAFYDLAGEYVADTFSSLSYARNDGSVQWSGDWTETNDDGLPTGGTILIIGNEIRIRDNSDTSRASIERTADTTRFGTATLTFKARTEAVDAADQIQLQVSMGGTWSTLATWTGTLATGTFSYDISAFISPTTRIRFVTSAGYSGNDSFFVDDVQIRGSRVTAGHWEVRVTMGPGDDINGLGLRAHDGNAFSGGTELNVYADSFVAVGANPPFSGTNSESYTLYPYITSGCSCGSDDFDYDSNSGNTGSLAYTSRTGSFTRTFAASALSQNEDWKRNTFSGWTSDFESGDYGVWTLDAAIHSYLVGGTPNGNYANLRMATSGAAATAPVTNPAPNSFRIYLPTDGGAAPPKPYLEQVLRGSGAPETGVTKRYTVTVRVVNPTAHPITFNATNLVVANVPGWPVVYAGNAMVGQGSITSQPAVGGSGNVTWNPGTVAAGATTLLSYQVLVTPSSAGQRIGVTGTPASGNGTRATFLDETANSAQARATYTFGPLCEVAVTEGLLTDVSIASFDAAVRGNSTRLEWVTAAESGTVGFNVLRVSSGSETKVNGSLLPADYASPQGGRYRFVDTRNSDPSATYILEEVTSAGSVNRYGPFVINGKAAGEGSNVFERESRVAGTFLKPAQRGGRKGRSIAAAVGVDRAGVVRVAASDLASALGVPHPQVTGAIRSGRVRVTEGEREVRVTSDTGGDAILFIARAPDSIYSRERVYRVTLERGAAMHELPVAPATSELTVFRASVDHEVDAFAATAVPLDPEGDYWFGAFVVPGADGYDRSSTTVVLPEFAGGDGRVAVRLQGAIAGAARRVRIDMNGVPLGEAAFEGLASHVADLEVPAGVLRAGDNVVDVIGIPLPGVDADVFYVDGVTVEYRRVARADRGILEIPVDGSRTVSAAGFSADVLAFDVTAGGDGLLRGYAVTGGSLAFRVPDGTNRVLLSDRASLVTPAFVKSVSEPILRRDQRADYVVIAPPSLFASAERLAALRRSEGLQTLVVDLEQVYDEFSGSGVTPHAIRDFIASTRSWSRVPRYFVLAGNGTFDYRSLLFGAGLLPPLMTRTAHGLFASDSLFGDFDGDGLPDVAIGRLTVADAAELDAYTEKLVRSRAATVDSREAVFVDDTTDRGAVFSDATLRSLSAAGEFPALRLSMDRLGFAGTREALSVAWQQGTPFVNWIGHGGLDRLSGEGIVTNDSVPELASASGLLPVVLAMTCSINRFEIGYVEALGSALTRGSSGATAVWAPSGLSSHGEAAEMNRTFLKLAATADAPRVGDLVVETLRRVNPSRDTGSVYLLLGDPAEKLRLPVPSVQPAPFGSGE